MKILVSLQAGDTVQVGDEKKGIRGRHSGWITADLVGTTILRSDLMFFEYRGKREANEKGLVEAKP